jgi:hypothetical protein
LDISPIFYEMFFLHIANFQFIEALDCNVEHLNIAKYAQILVE